jgi:hypothetical protein
MNGRASAVMSVFQLGSRICATIPSVNERQCAAREASLIPGCAIGMPATCEANHWAVPKELGLGFFALFIAAGTLHVGSPRSTADPSS